MEFDDGEKVEDGALVVEFVVEEGFGVRGGKEGVFFLPGEVCNGVFGGVGGDEEGVGEKILVDYD